MRAEFCEGRVPDNVQMKWEGSQTVFVKQWQERLFKDNLLELINRQGFSATDQCRAIFAVIDLQFCGFTMLRVKVKLT